MKTKSILAGMALAAMSAVNAQSWQLVGDQADMSGKSYAIAISKINNMIYSAGNLKYGSLTANQVFKWDFTEWAPVGNVDIGSGKITKMLLDKTDKIYVTGDFTNAAGKYYIKYWNGTSWGALGNLVSTIPFRDFITDGTNFYVVGNFVNPATGESCYINKWDGTSWSLVTGSNFNGIVNSIALDADNNLIAGGEMKNALNQYGVYRIINGTSNVEIGRLRGTLPVKKVSYNKVQNIIIAGTTINNGTKYLYDAASNSWTSKNFQHINQPYWEVTDFADSGHMLWMYILPDAVTSGGIPVSSVSEGTSVWLPNSAVNGNSVYYSDAEFDKFGYLVYGDANSGKVFRWSQQISTPLATNESTRTKQISVAPNPTTGIFTIKGNEKINSAEIYDTSGKLIKKTTPNAASTEMNISGQPKGTYLLRTSSDKKTETQKIILK